MRETEARGWIVLNSSRALMHRLRFAAVAVGIGLVMTAGVARAQDAEEDDLTFEEKLLKNFMAGLGAKSMENPNIEYRERSPLVVPPKLDLPPPASVSAEVKAANWPKDPDEAQRKAAIAARKKRVNPLEGARVLSPSELNVGGKAVPSRASNDSTTPGDTLSNPVLSPAQLGYTGGLSGIFTGGNKKTETATFKGEPTRESLTQPPVGYQTPSPNYAYGTGSTTDAAPPTRKYDAATGKYAE